MNAATLAPALRFLPAAALGLLAGCVVPPAQTQVTPAVPAVWRAPVAPAPEQGPAPSLADRPWGDLFRDPVLDALITEALANNSDLRIAAERVEIARAQYRVQRADRLPGVAATGDFKRQSAPSPVVPGTNVTTNAWTAGLAVPAWEIDLWGRVKSLSGSARARYLAAEHNRRAFQLSLVAEVAGAYLNLVGLDTQVRIAAVTLATRENSRSLVAQRHEAGVASGLDLRQAEILAATARRSLAELERQRARQENALSLLVGRAPGPVVRDALVFTRALPPLLPAGVPADLVARRPDLLSAAEGLRAADLDVDAARKTFLPTVSITGFLGFVSPTFGDLIDDDRAAWNVQPSVALPLFQAGRLRGNLAMNRARQRIAAETYVLAVRNAFREVEDALADHQSYVGQLAASQTVVEAARDRLRLATLRYDEGVSAYFEVLDASRELFSAELDHVQVTRAAYATVIQLYRVLGGGLAEPPPEPSEEPAATPSTSSAPVAR